MEVRTVLRKVEDATDLQRSIYIKQKVTKVLNNSDKAIWSALRLTKGWLDSQKDRCGCLLKKEAGLKLRWLIAQNRIWVGGWMLQIKVQLSYGRVNTCTIIFLNEMPSWVPAASASPISSATWHPWSLLWMQRRWAALPITLYAQAQSRTPGAGN
jgi:hypothetical protein